MPTWIALFRGINVGGKNILPMVELKRVLESAGCENIRSYIQSGNLVVSSSTKSKRLLTGKMLKATEESFGFRPNLVLLSVAEFSSAIQNNPFPVAVAAPKTLHFFFLETQPTSPDLDGIAKLAIPSEQFRLIDKVFYLYTPEGLGTSRLANSAERKLGVYATARNFNTVLAIAEMVSGKKRA